MRLLTLVVLTLAVAIAPILAQDSPPKIPFESDLYFFKLNYQMNLGEVLAVAVNSKGSVVVLRSSRQRRYPGPCTRKRHHAVSGVRFHGRLPRAPVTRTPFRPD